MKLGIVGSRKLDDYQIVEDAINKYFKNVSFIISGGAQGTDSLGILYAQIHKIPYLEHLPDLKKYKDFAQAAMARNTLVVEDSDAIIAFWDGKSAGTKDSINKAKSSNTPLTIIKI